MGIRVFVVSSRGNIKIIELRLVQIQHGVMQPLETDTQED